MFKKSFPGRKWLRLLGNKLGRSLCLLLIVTIIITVAVMHGRKTSVHSTVVKHFHETDIRNLLHRPTIPTISRLHNSEAVPVEVDTRRIVTIALPPGRAGNSLFAFASLFGIADLNDFQPQLYGVACYLYTSVFKSPVVCNESLSNTTCTPYLEELPGVYSSGASKISTKQPNRTTPVRLQGYFQSWKYFAHSLDRIISQFQFRDHVLSRVSTFFQEHVRVRDPVTGLGSVDDVRLIGVHVRRGDMASTEAEFHGYVAAPPAYIHNAMLYFEEMYGKTSIIFVIASDEIDWCKEHVNIRQRRAIFSGNFTTAEDLALLSMCDDVIITSGTYGWWGAYLAGGKTIYYNQYPLMGSRLSSLMSTRDYYPSGWVGLSELREVW